MEHNVNFVVDKQPEQVISCDVLDGLTRGQWTSGAQQRIFSPDWRSIAAMNPFPLPSMVASSIGYDIFGLIFQNGSVN